MLEERGEGRGRPRVPVMVLNWNGWADTFRCLETLAAGEPRPLVWLVDNGSDVDRTGEVLERLPDTRVLRWPTNLGYAGGYNRALAQASAEGYEFAYLLNNDCEVRAGFLQEVLEVALSDPELAAVGSCILFASSPAFVHFDGAYHRRGEQETRPFDARPTHLVDGAGMLMRLRAGAATHFFDERYFCYGEETDWCRRALAAGWRLAVCGRSLVHHWGQASDRNANATYYRTRNAFLGLESMGWPRRSLWTLKLLHRASLDVAAESHPADHPERVSAVACAVSDALRGRYGERSSTTAPGWARMLGFWGARFARAT